MKNKIWFTINVLFSLVIAFFAFGEHSNAQKKDVWEYKTQIVSLNPIDRPEAVLNKLGEEGWELYLVTEVPNYSGSGFIFRRKK